VVFIDETWTKTNMSPLRGWGPRSERPLAKVPHGRWKTLTFIAVLRHDRVAAPWLIEGPINAETFLLYVEKVLGRARRRSTQKYTDGSEPASRGLMGNQFSLVQRQKSRR
jgi:hypothetical protein